MAIVFFAALLICSALVEGQRAAPGHHVVDVGEMMLSAAADGGCTTSEGGSAIAGRLQLSHRYGPCSPLSGQEPQPSPQEHLRRHQSRVDSIIFQRSMAAASGRSARRSRSLAASTISAQSGFSLGNGDFVVNVSFGTPEKPFAVIFDTASDLTWIQCAPCGGSCYHQSGPIFDPFESSSYSNISCSAASCNQLSNSKCSDDTCLYSAEYGDNYITTGFLASETLTLNSPSETQLPQFLFGCSQANQGNYGEVAGMLGLGQQPLSLVSQSLAQFGGKFSYCLPSSRTSFGYLTFGGSPPPNVKFTPMLTEASFPNFYFVNLVGVSVSNLDLLISPSVFSVAGTIIDSSATITQLPPKAYSLLRAAFRQGMEQYPLVSPYENMDTCYDLSGYAWVVVPEVALKFDGGATLNLNVSGTLFQVANSFQYCLAFSGGSSDTDLAFIGNIQQKTFDVFYDVANSMIGFSPGGCS